MNNTTKFTQFNCENCIHKTESNGLKGCAFFGLNEDEINGKYQDETRIGKSGTIPNGDLRNKFGVHIPREGTTIGADRLLKDYVNNNRCTELK